MNKLISSTLMTIIAVPFLMAAPSAKKAQNGTAPAPTATATTKKANKKHAKKASKPAVTPAATDAKK